MRRGSDDRSVVIECNLLILGIAPRHNPQTLTPHGHYRRSSCCSCTPGVVASVVAYLLRAVHPLVEPSPSFSVSEAVAGPVTTLSPPLLSLQCWLKSSVRVLRRGTPLNVRRFEALRSCSPT